MMSAKKYLFTIFFISFCLFLYADNQSRIYLNRMLNSDERSVNKSSGRLSSGKILLTDDPANYVIYEKMEAYIRGFEKEIGNINDLISYYKTQDGVLGNITDILQRIKELLLQRTDGILSESDREIIDSEINQLYEEIIYQLKESEFNKIKMFKDFFDNQLIKNIFDKKYFLNQKNIEALFDFILKQRVIAGTKSKTLEFSVRGKTNASQNAQEMQLHGDTDFSSEISNFKRNQILLLSNIMMLNIEKK